MRKLTDAEKVKWVEMILDEITTLEERADKRIEEYESEHVLNNHQDNTRDRDFEAGRLSILGYVRRVLHIALNGPDMGLVNGTDGTLTYIKKGDE